MMTENDDDYILRGLPARHLATASAIMAEIWATATVEQLEALAARDSLSTEMIAEGAEQLAAINSPLLAEAQATREMRAALREEIRSTKALAHL